MSDVHGRPSVALHRMRHALTTAGLHPDGLKGTGTLRQSNVLRASPDSRRVLGMRQTGEPSRVSTRAKRSREHPR